MRSSSRPRSPRFLQTQGALLGLLFTCWLPAAAQCGSIDGAWTLVPGFTSQVARARHAMIYDPVNRRAVVFGGLQGAARRNDVWVLPLDGVPAWAQLLPSGTPPTPRSDFAAIHDPARGRMVVFGGDDGALQNEVWVLSLGSQPAWTRLDPAGTPPSRRRGAVAVYDPPGDRMIIVGGYDGAARNDVWALSLGANPVWTLLAPTGTPPSGREGAAAIYDPNYDRLVLFGGYNAVTNKWVAETWLLSLSGPPVWKRDFTPGAEPGPRAWCSAIHDPVNNIMVLVGGSYALQSNSETSALMLNSTPSWSAWGSGPASMARRQGHGALYDPQQRRMVVFGGLVDHEPNFSLSDVWSFRLTGPMAWERVLPANELPFPSPRREFCAAMVHDDLVVFGGEAAGAFTDDAFVRSMTGGPWLPLEDSGIRPPGRTDAEAIYDPPGNRLLVMGGVNAARLSDVWEYSFGSRAWHQLVASSFALEHLSGAVYDPLRQRVVLLDSGTSAALYTMQMRLDDYSVSVIFNPQPSGSIPSVRYAYSVIVQPPRDRLVVFGGVSQGHANDEVWFLPLSGPAIWSRAVVQGTPPTARWGHTAAYDDARDRMIVIGGFNGSVVVSDAWELSLGDTPTWTPLNPLGAVPSARDAAGALYDAPRQRVVLFGGFDPGAPEFLNDLGFLSFAGNVSVGAPRAARLSLAGARPNPAPRGFSVEFSLEDASPARLELYDLAGRRLFTREVGALGAGDHILRFDEARTAAAGLYFLRLSQHARALTSRVLVTR